MNCKNFGFWFGAFLACVLIFVAVAHCQDNVYQINQDGNVRLVHQYPWARMEAAWLAGFCVSDWQIGLDPGAQVNACKQKVSLGEAKGIYTEKGGTILTPIVFDSVSNFTWLCAGADTGWGSGNLVNGITGNPSGPAVKISGTSSYITIKGCAIVGNGQTGASGNGNGFSIIGTGPTPAEIKFENVSVTGHKGNGTDGTGASMAAAGIYSYQSIDIFVNHSSLQSNQHAIFADSNSNDFYVTNSIINGNLTDGIAAHLLTTLKIDSDDIESQTGSGVVLDTITGAQISNTHYESNTACLTVNGAIGFTTGLVYGPNNYCASGVNNASVVFSIGAVKPKVVDSVFVWGASVTAGIGVDVSDGVLAPQVTGNQFYVVTGGTVSHPIILRGPGTGSISPLIEGNQFGRTQANVDGTLTRMVDLQSPTKNATVRNNSGYANSGAVISNGIVIESGVANTFAPGNTVTAVNTGNVPASAVSDSGTNTFFAQKITGTVTTAGTAVAAGTCQAQSGITLTGATTSDAAMVSLNAAAPATWQTGIQWNNPEVTANTCTIRLCNPTAGSITPAATAVRCTVIR